MNDTVDNALAPEPEVTSASLAADLVAILKRHGEELAEHQARVDAFTLSVHEAEAARLRAKLDGSK